MAIICQTNAHAIADIITLVELKAKTPPNRLTIGDSGSSSMFYEMDGYEVVALRGIHVGPISQYLVNLEGIKVFYGSDSRYWRHKDITAEIAFVPTGTAMTCSPEIALAMVMDLESKFAVPIHGRKQQMSQLKGLMENLLPDVEVIVPERFKLIQVSVFQYFSND